MKTLDRVGRLSHYWRNVKKAEKFVLEDAQIKILAEIIKLSVGIIHAILHNKLNLSKVSTRLVPQILTVPQKSP